MSAEHLPRAAGRLGLRAARVARLPSSLPALLLPAIVLLKSGEGCLLAGRSARGRKARVVFPHVSARARTVRMSDLDRDAAGEVFVLTPEADDGARSISREGERTRGHWLWSTAGRFWPAWLQVVVSAFVLNLLGLAFPLFVMNVYDRVIPNSAMSTLWALTLGVMIALAFELVLRQLRTHVLDRVGRLVDLKVGAQLFAQALRVRMADRRQTTGAVVNQIREFDKIREFMTSATVIAATDLLFIGLGVGLLAMLVGPIAILPMIAVPIVLVFTLLVQIPLGRAVRATNDFGAQRQAVLIEALRGIEAIKALSAEGVLQRRWEQAVAGSGRAASTTRFWSSLALHGAMTIQQVVGVAIVAWGVLLVAEGRISMGSLIAASMLAARILSPLVSIAQTLARAQQSLAAFRAIGRFMALERDGGGAGSGAPRVASGAIAFHGVRFAYPDARLDALRDIDLVIAPGERVGVIGRVGSGKSTLGRLLVGLYAPDQGAITVDGIQVDDYQPADLRAGIGFVSQETELFDGTLRENVTLGARDASEADIADACRVAGVDAISTAHPAGFMMPVGESGRALSGGQRQAVVLARMLLRRPTVLFLDEPTSAMDIGGEADLVRRLREWLRPEQTLILSTHRVSLLELVDRLIVLEKGAIVADGPKDHVLRQLKIHSATPSLDGKPGGRASR